MCDVYLMRDKADQSMASIKRMHSERKALVKILQKHAPQMLEPCSPNTRTICERGGSTLRPETTSGFEGLCQM